MSEWPHSRCLMVFDDFFVADKTAGHKPPLLFLYSPTQESRHKSRSVMFGCSDIILFGSIGNKHHVSLKYSELQICCFYKWGCMVSKQFTPRCTNSYIPAPLKTDDGSTGNSSVLSPKTELVWMTCSEINAKPTVC